MLVDSHCHLNMLNLDDYQGDLDQLVAETLTSGVERMLSVATDLKSSTEVPAIAAKYPEVYASVGIHPHDATMEVVSTEKLTELSRQPKVVAIGETGLDYYYNEEGLDLQQESFRRHITIAIAEQKPLIIHTRKAREDTIRIMQEMQAEECGGVMHCFTESWDMAKQALDMGFYISISGIVTFKKAEELRETAKQIPLDRLLIETDSPYLAPVPMRGKQNQPKYVKYVAEFLAELRGISYQELTSITGQNFMNLFF